MSAGNEQRKLAAIMFTDMVGYSALSQRDDKLAQELLEEHRQLLREIFPRFNGTEIKTIGDAFLVEFDSALEAAQCAIEIQRTLAKRNHDVTSDRRIELKIGIHIGDVIHREGDVYGDGVNIASRIEPLAGAGEICVSMDVERQIRNALEARFEKLAPTELQNISVPMDLFRIALPWERPGTPVAKIQTQSISRKFLPPAIALVLLLIVGLGWWWTAQSRRHPASPAAPSTVAVAEKGIAVLPFEKLSDEKQNAYFTDGVQDEILTDLAKIADLKVISRTSVMQYKSGVARNLREIGLPMAYHAPGRKADSDAALAALIAKYEKEAPYNIAYVYAFRGEADKAFEWLDKAVEYGDPGLSGIVAENLFDNIRKDPRWLPFLRKLGKAPEQLAKIEFKVTLPHEK